MQFGDPERSQKLSDSAPACCPLARSQIGLTPWLSFKSARSSQVAQFSIGVNRFRTGRSWVSVGPLSQYIDHLGDTASVHDAQRDIAVCRRFQLCSKGLAYSA